MKTSKSNVEANLSYSRWNSWSQSPGASGNSSEVQNGRREPPFSPLHYYHCEEKDGRTDYQSCEEIQPFWFLSFEAMSAVAVKATSQWLIGIHCTYYLEIEECEQQ
ncbi:uncharacterized protein M8220_004857 isoform 2-T2 [Acridotheres tristis]